MTDTAPLSIQLYTLRSLGSLDRALDAVAAAGYRHVELVGSHLDDAAATEAGLRARGLAVSGSHVSLAALRERFDAVADACRRLGFEQLFMPAVPPEQRDMDAAGWRALGTELAQLADRAQREKLKLGYHNHDWELRKKAGETTALELIFASAGAAPLSWEVDVAWLVRGGADPKQWIARYRDRVAAAHVKDLAPAGQNTEQDGWADVGAGVLDWPALWRTCRDAGAAWMVVEHDKPADPPTSVRASFDYIRAMAA
ncbi:MAG TPA: sugar phosphate isomerase/epimerase [Acetobacteraceae bacterium]|jgi:sugar phosphate isomerase/epimerase|nr:sugar phosphate isomerase/epimerase [Acetobacteraceae bacterium]